MKDFGITVASRIGMFLRQVEQEVIVDIEKFFC
jgi:hypothetical protein